MALDLGVRHQPSQRRGAVLAQAGLSYAFVEADTSSAHSPYGTVVADDLVLAAGPLHEITSMAQETVLDTGKPFSAVEESFWVTTVDASGAALAWPVRTGSAHEEVDSDVPTQRGSVALPA